MITIEVGETEFYNEETNEFIYDKGGLVRFEYSLRVVFEWEGRWKKPFLKGQLTNEEMVDLYMHMALDPIKLEHLTEEVMQKLSDYVGDTHTATTFSKSPDGQNDNNKSSNGKIFTTEELYAMMFAASVPLEFEDRNLNRLLVILRVISSYNNPPKKMSKTDIYKQNASLNAQRKALLKSKG